jgi:hypothetical protein
LFCSFEVVRFEIRRTFAGGDLAATIGEFGSRVLKTRKVLESPFSIHFTAQDVIVRYRFLEDPVSMKT